MVGKKGAEIGAVLMGVPMMGVPMMGVPIGVPMGRGRRGSGAKVGAATSAGAAVGATALAVGEIGRAHV